ncbi:hypothetical protein [Stieleria varia]|uniref:Ser-Thr-rich glycosyl-phosphatidyl-inositol-anchored membrane family protein n=1 Tax=Stieleria varia TaxID=2528005 RepID=A0A5C6ALD2_9BACT|nr:hypothetical protein [Stieleria varia]TWU00833.1 hypothetical protein Pla52n_42020 [Stieleria varia]
MRFAIPALLASRNGQFTKRQARVTDRCSPEIRAGRFRSVLRDALAAGLLAALTLPSIASAQWPPGYGPSGYAPAGNGLAANGPLPPLPPPAALSSAPASFTGMATTRTSAPPPTPSQRPSPDAVILHSRSFGIPVNVDARQSQPVEVQLYVAQGEKASWQLIDRRDAGVSEFQFVGQTDGEFWFATRTVDAAGQPHPSGTLQPQLKVFVDSTKPSVTLNAQADASGSVIVELSTADATPVRSLQLHYATDSVRQWQSIDTRSLMQTSTPGNGSLVIRGESSWQQMSVQAIVVDAAGNQTIQTEIVHRPRIAAGATRALAAASPGQDHGGVNAKTVAGPNSPNYINASDSSGLNSPPSQSFPAPTIPEIIPPGQATYAPRPATPQSIDADSLTPETKPPAAQKPVAPKPRRTLQQAMRPLESAENIPTPKPDGDVTTPSPETIPPQGFRPSLGSQSPTRSSAEDKKNSASSTPRKTFIPGAENIPMSSGRSEAYEANRAAQAEYDRALLANKVAIRHSDSLRFSLEYELEAVGNTGVDAVELYGSTDAGKTWRRWGADPDRTSPFDIETSEEGTFCFRIVVLGRNGLASPRPLPGETPDIAVVVDQTPPKLDITAARYGEGDQVGALVIEYECRDDNLMQRPIALSFGESTEGPWSTIASGLRNDGSHVWPADPQLPREIYLRIDATDQAGNIGTYILDQPIDTLGLAPRARILGFRPR